MDWIKVKTTHILDEYTDLSDSEFRAWIKLMALTARLEHEPSQEQINEKRIHHKTLNGLLGVLSTHQTTLKDILKKVLTDVQDVSNRRNYWKQKQKEKREYNKTVNIDVNKMSSDRLDIDKNKELDKHICAPKKIAFALPDWIKKETWEAYREMRQRKRAPLTDRAATLIVRELERLKAQGNDPESVLNQSIMKSWTGVFPVDKPQQSKYSPTDGRPTPKVYHGDDMPDKRAPIPDAIRALTKGIG